MELTKLPEVVASALLSSISYIRAFQSQIYELFIYKKSNGHVSLSSRIQAPNQLSRLRSRWLSLPQLKLYLPRPHRQLPLMVVLMAVVMEVQQPPPLLIDSLTFVGMTRIHISRHISLILLPGAIHIPTSASDSSPIHIRKLPMRVDHANR